MEELLIEQWNTPIEIVEYKDLPLQEQKSNFDKNGVYIQGVFMQADVINGNKRLYPKKVLEKAIDNYIKEQVERKQSLGELNHPPRPFADPLQACLVIEKLWWEGNNVMGIARITTGDYAQGDKVAALMKAGWVPGVSSRGLGKVVSKGHYNEVQDGFKLTVGVDIVWGPSAPNAFVKPIMENLENTKTSINKTNNNSNADQILEALNKFNKKNKDEKSLTSLSERVKTHFLK